VPEEQREKEEPGGRGGQPRCAYVRSWHRARR
jgi:hypothetical protein